MRRTISLIGAAIFTAGVSVAQLAGVFSGALDHRASFAKRARDGTKGTRCTDTPPAR